MHTSHWTLSILLAACCTLPATADVLGTPKSARKLPKARPYHLLLTKDTQAKARAKRLDEKIERHVKQTTLQAAQAINNNAQKQSTCTCKGPTSANQQERSELEQQQLRDSWTPESGLPFPMPKDEPTLAPKPQSNACQCKAYNTLEEPELYHAEEQLQHIRDTQDPNATLDNHPELLPTQNACACKHCKTHTK